MKQALALPWVDLPIGYEFENCDLRKLKNLSDISPQAPLRENLTFLPDPAANSSGGNDELAGNTEIALFPWQFFPF